VQLTRVLCFGAYLHSIGRRVPFYYRPSAEFQTFCLQFEEAAGKKVRNALLDITNGTDGDEAKVRVMTWVLFVHCWSAVTTPT
jgi:hypothetical protein